MAGPAEAILIVGTGAQAKYAIETFRQQGRTVKALLAIGSQPATGHLDGVPIVGHLDTADLAALLAKRTPALIACGSNAVKEETSRRLSAFDPAFTTCVHPTAAVATSAFVGEGTIVNAHATLQPFAQVGRHVMIHAGVVVEHDVVIEDFVNLAPRSCVTGHCRVDRGATVFAGAVLVPKVHVGAGATVGAGAVVLSDVGPGETVVGVPARPRPREIR